MQDLENYFEPFRRNTVGVDTYIETPYGSKKIVYADWIASGRLYAPIEKRLSFDLGQLVGNTHSESSTTGMVMTESYNEAHHIVKKHVNASKDDILLFTGSGMTGALAKLQRILGLKVPDQALKYCGLSQGEKYKRCKEIPNNERPIIFITHIEHHSNHTSWFETLCDVVVIEPGPGLTVDPENLRKEIIKYRGRSLLIGSFSACSNVTGYIPPYYELAKIMHENNGYCFIDFAASAPYVEINMHPDDPMYQLDAIFFSPHKFLGGPGSAGVLVFNNKLYSNNSPDIPGGGTVKWTNRWGEYSYITDIEVKEDGGTPGFLQGIKAALAIKLKEKMGIKNIHLREKELVKMTFDKLSEIKGLHILAPEIRDRLGVFSFYFDHLHHNLVTKLLNDRYGIQVRGGCSCAGTYGHFLLNVDYRMSKEITNRIEAGDLSLKPGWVRLSLHPTITNDELHYIINAIANIAEKGTEWGEEYLYDSHTNEFHHRDFHDSNHERMLSWFNPD
ncbi:MAG: aminotransferase class V-fold PLP-dependent enzyme [Bacteroidales bacterium]